MIDLLLTRGLRSGKVAFLLFAAAFLPSNAQAYLMTENGPESVIIQLVESLRLSDDLHQALADLAELEEQEGMTVERRWVGEIYLELLSFPQDFTEDEALAVIAKLEEWPSIEQVVTVSAENLAFRPGDFAREFAPTETIPEATLRGLDNDYYSLDPLPVDEQLVSAHHPTQFIVCWKDEYVWNGEETGFGATMADFNALTGTTVVSDLYSSAYELTQVLAIDPARTSLAEELQRYNDCPWVAYAQPNYFYFTTGGETDPSIIEVPEASDGPTGFETSEVVEDTGMSNRPGFVRNGVPRQRNIVRENNNASNNAVPSANRSPRPMTPSVRTASRTLEH